MDHHFSESLKIVKETLKVNNVELADLIGVSQHTIGRWESGYPLTYSKRSLVMDRLKQLIREVA